MAPYGEIRRWYLGVVQDARDMVVRMVQGYIMMRGTERPGMLVKDGTD